MVMAAIPTAIVCRDSQVDGDGGGGDIGEGVDGPVCGSLTPAMPCPTPEPDFSQSSALRTCHPHEPVRRSGPLVRMEPSPGSCFMGLPVVSSRCPGPPPITRTSHLRCSCSLTSSSDFVARLCCFSRAAWAQARWLGPGRCHSSSVHPGRSSLCSLADDLGLRCLMAARESRKNPDPASPGRHCGPPGLRWSDRTDGWPGPPVPGCRPDRRFRR